MGENFMRRERRRPEAEQQSEKVPSIIDVSCRGRIFRGSQGQDNATGEDCEDKFEKDLAERAVFTVIAFLMMMREGKRGDGEDIEKDEACECAQYSLNCVHRHVAH
jgi:hypothetical protein